MFQLYQLAAGGEISPAASPAEGQEAKLREPPEMRDHRRAPGGNFARCAISGSPLAHDKGRVLDSGRMCEHSSASKPTRGEMKPKRINPRQRNSTSVPPPLAVKERRNADVAFELCGKLIGGRIAEAFRDLGYRPLFVLQQRRSGVKFSPDTVLPRRNAEARFEHFTEMLVSPAVTGAEFVQIHCPGEISPESMTCQFDHIFPALIRQDNSGPGLTTPQELPAQSLQVP